MKNTTATSESTISYHHGVLTIRRRWRIPAMLLMAVILTAALWTALIRLGWSLPAVAGASAIEHGALMVSGFLGTLIALERAVALKRRWAYVAPAASALGTILILATLPPVLGRSLIVVAAVGLVAIFIFIYRRHPSADTAAMSIGAVLWLAGNLLWWASQPIAHAVPWWAGFLVLTIAGERLELARVLRLTPLVKRLFAGSIVVFLAGLGLSLISFDAGVRVAGAGLFLLAAWLIRYDIARRTIRMNGLTRYIAACLLPGYFWMAAAGVVWIVDAPYFLGGLYYDAMLHMVFLGFVFSMIFGHAPIILPSVLGVPVTYRPVFYVHLLMLHLSLAVRVAGDLLLNAAWRQWGGLFNVIAVLLFIALTAWSARRSRQPALPAMKV